MTTIFSESDVQEVIIHRQRSLEREKEDYYAYFSDLAIKFYVPFISSHRERILGLLTEEAEHKDTVSVPMLSMTTYAVGEGGTRERRRVMEAHLLGSAALFESPSGINRANIYAICKHSSFVADLNKLLGGGLFLGVLSRRVRTVDGITEYEVKITINLNIRH